MTRESDLLDVSIDGFSGPLTLLLQLINDARLPIVDVSLTEVTDAYVAKARQLAEWDLDKSGEFVSLAATLLLIKTNALLPVHTDSEPDDELGLLTHDLIEQLLDHQELMRGRQWLADQLDGAWVTPPRPVHQDLAQLENETEPHVIAGDLRSLFEAMASVIRERPEPVFHVLSPDSMSLSRAATIWRDRLRDRPECSLFDTFSEGWTRLEAMLLFIGALHLAKDGVAQLNQVEPLGDIILRRLAPSV